MVYKGLQSTYYIFDDKDISETVHISSMNSLRYQ